MSKGYSSIVASNSSNEDAMLCVFMWNIRSWCGPSWSTWRCSSAKSGSSAPGFLIQLVSESAKLCLKAKHWSYTWDTPILLVWMMIYILGRKPLNTSHESHQSKRSDDFWQQVSHPGGIEGLLVFALEGRDWRQYRHLGAVLGSPHKSSSSTDTDYAIVWAPVEETLSTEKRRKKQNFLSHVYVHKFLRMTEPLYTSFLIPTTQKSAFYSSWDLWSWIIRFVASSGLSFVM